MKRRLRTVIPPEIKVNARLLYRLGLSIVTKPCLPEKRFVIYGLGRTGKTLLVSLLNSHDDIHCDDEILHHFVLFPQRHVLSSASMYHTKAYGFTLLTYQLEDIQPFLQPRRFLVHLHESGFKIIHLTRTDLLWHALSNIYAHGVRRNGRSPETPFAKRAIRVEVQDVLKWLKGIEAIRSFEIQMLKDIPYLSLTYEENLQNRVLQQRAVDMICDFIGIPPAPVSTNLQKTPERLSDLALNLKEIYKALDKTPYARFLPDTQPGSLEASSRETGL